MNRRQFFPALAAGIAAPAVAFGQAAPSDPQRETNAKAVGLMTAGLGGVFVVVGANLMEALNGPDLTVLPILSAGSVQNIRDLLWLSGIDVAIVQADVLAWAEQHQIEPGITQKVAYITRLFDEPVHILTSRSITDIRQLAGKEINADAAGSGSAMTAEVLFQRLKIPVRITNQPTPLALERLKSGDLPAVMRVVAQPAPIFEHMDDPKLHLLPVPYSPVIGDVYSPAIISAYPKLTPSPVNSIAVSAILACFNWTPDSGDRYARTALFVRQFFAKFPMLLHQPFHPAWHQVNLAGNVPGWTRWSVAQQQLDAMRAQAQRPDEAAFARFLRSNGIAASEQEQRQLFQRFLQWSKGR